MLSFTDSVATEILQEFERFWQLAPKFKARNLIHKRGILLYGPPGTGKTASIMLMAQHLIEQYQGIVLRIYRPDEAIVALQQIRKIEPDRPIVCVMEDFETMINNQECKFLSLLDGEDQIDKVVFVATTNYIKKLDKRFTDRPSRFDLIREIGIPSDANRREYLLYRDATIENVDEWVKVSHTFSLAHLREMIILVQCYGLPLDVAAQRIHDMRKGRHLKTAEEMEEKNA